ncbi:hypothetical protein EDB84DRAFT_1443387, partial [Lactarius hengduanensis]
MDHNQSISNSTSTLWNKHLKSPNLRKPIPAIIRAHNVPQFKTTFGGKREYFVTITYGATTKKTKRQTEKSTKSVHIDGQMAVWDQRLDAFFVRPSSHLILCLYAKRLTKHDILIGTREMAIPVESESYISVTLGGGNGQTEQSSPPVTLDLTITVSANGTSPSDPQIIPTEEDDTIAGDVPQPTMAPDSRGPDPSSATGHLLHPPDHLPGSSTL